MGDVSGTTLAVFTSFAPTGAVAFIALAFALLAHPHRERAERDRTMHLLFIPLAATWAGFIASATHLGTPANALYAFAGVGRSPLSNEVVAVVAFLFVSGLLWLYSFKRDYSLALANTGLVLGACAAGCLLYFTGLAYDVNTVPTWTTPLAPVSLVLGGACSGLSLAAVVLHIGEGRASRAQWVLLGLSVLMLILGSAASLQYGGYVATVGNNIQPAGSVGANYPVAVGLHAAIAVLGIALQIVARKASFKTAARGTAPSKAAYRIAFDLIGTLLAISATVLVRMPFYATYLSVGF